MAIKTRLVLAMASLLCIATIIIGTTATTAVVNSMTDNIDAQLRETVRQTSQVSSYNEFIENTAVGGQIAYQQMAVLLVTQDGVVEEAQPAGFADDPEPLPNVTNPLPPPGTCETVDAISGQTQYRILVSDDQTLAKHHNNSTANRRLIVATPLTEVNVVRNNLILTMAVTVTLVLTVGIVAAIWITRRGMQPVTNMIDAATAVADGDLDKRLPARSQRTEIGKLATALNIMVSKLVDAITQRDNQQARLRRFIADASHELRTPLAAISGYAELYESGGVKPGPALDRAVTRISSESRRMATLVDDLLLLTRLDQDTALARRALDLRQLAYDAVDDARAVDASRHIDIHAEAAVVIQADEARIRQVIVNLLSNAVTHTPDGTHVAVTVTRYRNDAVLTVSDDGPGIPSVHRQKVFDRFYRADDSRSRETGGTGLGLAIVKSIVEFHDGSVELDSQLGKGTMFRIVLPIAPEVSETDTH